MTKAIPSLICTLTILFLLSAETFGSYDRNDEVKAFINQLNSSDISVRIDAAKNITKSAIINSHLYDEIEKKLIDLVKINPSGLGYIDEISWLCKALASSGDRQYQSTILEIIENTSNSKIKYYATQSYLSFDEYKKRNDIINDTSLYDKTLSPEENRIANMLRSDKVSIKHDGAKIISREKNISNKMYEIINKVLIENYSKNLRVSEHVDAMALLCKSLATSKDNKYLSSLKKILNSTNSEKLKNYAQQGIDSLSSAE